jgi:lipoprotein NlpI
VFPVRYELDLYILFRRNSVFKMLTKYEYNYERNRNMSIFYTVRLRVALRNIHK